jgi:hypothetical protein
MDVATFEADSAEAATAAADGRSDLSEDEEDGLGEVLVNEAIKPVFFNTSLLRLVKILIGATVLTVIVNPPSSLYTSSAVSDEAPAAHATLSNASSSSIVVEVAAEVIDFADAEAEAVAEKVSAIIAPTAISLVRQERKQTVVVGKKRSTISTKAEAVFGADVSQPVVNIATRSTGTPVVTGTATDTDHDGVSAAAWKTETAVRQFSSRTERWTWRDASWLPHMLIAVVVLLGFAIHLRIHLVQLLQSVPELVRKIRA